MPILEVKNLSVWQNRKSVLEGISFSVEKGENLAVIGPNGAGKTTLFRAILGAQRFRGEIIKAPGTKFGYVPQKLDLERDLPITVKEFLTLRPHEGKDKNHSPESVLNMVGLTKEFLKRKIGELSSGELQRIMVAWSVIGHPDILLFDEPTASIDVSGQETVYELLHKLQDEQGLAVILISHDLSVVYKYVGKVLCLNKNQICFGPPAEVLTPLELEKLYGGKKKFYHHIHETHGNN
ncbi:MAG: hypothetical protein UW30_C0019G0014 [Candidatus Giovannonibacteria bacterium GW2011_GWA2_44_13b]|uniref:ABC transporter domain-containing protein n=2 Tax=Candidatus Giovannoniibacteriota TaxID=1752738 RepID=A0A0G1H199_9BACT|nr:MAG: hypothetical protein UW30_C0019G0014 [Candidatus Giovannonibacteria bacterium GW2011_GWA2_44_13b]OGF82757.1 MAG: hypothetical protein A2924_03470 [Candidatus Giovannonibacteria bacterium RIFCSPLOWO2_01_FULL_44_16]